MKTIHEFLSDFDRLDVRLWVDGDKLCYSAPNGILTNEQKTVLRSRKSEIVEFLQKTKSHTQPIQVVPRDGNLPLSFAQARMWFIEQLEANGTTANLSGLLHIKGSLQVTALEQSLRTIVERHEILRTTLKAVNGQPLQVILPRVTLTLPLVDLRSLSEPERQVEVQRLALQESCRPFDLARDLLPRVTLLRLGDTEYMLLLTMHHIVADGWSMAVLFRELKVLYQAFVSGKPVPLPKLTLQYADFATWQRQFLQGEVLERELAYWKQQLQGAPTLLQLPTDRPRPPVQTFAGKTQSFVISQTLTESLKTLSQASGVTLFMTLLAVFGTLLYRYTGQEDIPIGSPSANRNRVELEGLIGCFINTLVFRTDLSGNPSFRDLLNRVRQVALAAYAHQNLPFEKLVDELQPVRDLSYSPLFQVMFVLQNFSQEIELPGLSLHHSRIDIQTSQFDLTFDVVEEKFGLTGKLEYNTDLFDDTTIARTIGHLQTLLTGIVANPDQRISELPLLTPAERHQLLTPILTPNQTLVGSPRYRCIHQLFEAQVEQTPDAVAVMFQDQQLTYRELNRRANQLAHYLKKLGVKPEVLVGICVERSLLMLVGLLGILKAGGAYVPIDPAYPEERITFLLSDSRVSVLLTQADLVAKLPWQSSVCLDADWALIEQESGENLVSHPVAENLVYTIYTSGSTGKPKGVMIQHQSLVNYTQAAIAEFAISQEDRILQFASISFDTAAEEIFPCLARGATLILRTEEMLSSISTFLQRCGEWQLTVLDLPTALWHQLVDELPTLNLTLPDTVRLVIIGGEKASPERLSIWQQQVDRGVRLVNTYGPTEATIVTTTVDLSAQIAGQELPIGNAISNALTYILDSHLQPVPVGVPGELYIGGIGVARGYLNRPELTALAFIPDPFSEIPGARLYKTGDRVRYQTDGRIEFLGRSDRQVKIRGFRIELGEIESAISQHPFVRETIVTVRSDELNIQRLVAYVVLHRTQTPTNSELRGFLESKLPKYMMPAAFVILEALPLTPNGKVARKALPAPDRIHPELEKDFIAPQTTVEKQLAAIWSQVLNVETVGIKDNFFELGGDSILSLQIIAKANQAGLYLTPKQLFQFQTIAQLADVAGTTSRIQAEQDVVTGVVPLTPIQHWFFSQKQPDPDRWNQAILLEVKQSLDLVVLEQAVQFLQRYHDALRLRFLQQESGIQAVIASPEDKVPLTYLDLSALPQVERVAAMEAMATKLQASLNLSTGPLFQVALFDLGGDNPYRLLWAIHHLVVDWVSWRILIEDLQTAYQQISQGNALLPPKTTSFKQWSYRLQDYANSSVLRLELDYWLAIQHQPRSPIPLDYPRTDNTVATARRVSMSLGVEETQVLLQQVPAVYQTQINDVLLTALTQAFAQWTGENSLLVDLEGHGREEFEDINLSRTVGWFTSIFPVHLSLENAFDPGTALKVIKEQLRAIPNRGMGYGVLRYLSKDEEITEQLSSLPKAEVVFNYLGQFDQVLPDSSLFRLASESTGATLSWRSKRAYWLDINAGIAQGRLQVNWNYSETLHRQTTVEALAQEFIKALRALIAHCQSPYAGGFTSSDFAEFTQSQWSQADIDAIATALEDI